MSLPTVLEKHTLKTGKMSTSEVVNSLIRSSGLVESTCRVFWPDTQKLPQKWSPDRSKNDPEGIKNRPNESPKKDHDFGLSQGPIFVDFGVRIGRPGCTCEPAFLHRYRRACMSSAPLSSGMVVPASADGKTHMF